MSLWLTSSAVHGVDYLWVSQWWMARRSVLKCLCSSGVIACNWRPQSGCLGKYDWVSHYRRCERKCV